MNILNLASGQDTGGQQGRTTSAFRKHAPDWTYTSVTQRHTFYPVETAWNARQIRTELWPAADVVHLHNSLLSGLRFQRLMPKPRVIHYHGTMFRSNPKSFIADQRKQGVIGLTSTLDLWALAPNDTEWLPAPYDLDWLKSLRNHHGTDTFRIAHAPTSRKVKDTDTLIAAVKRLRAEGHDVELDIIEGRPWAECLERKAQADLYVDQLLLGYGCNAIEAWGMGIPVIAGVDPARARGILSPQRIPDDTLDIMERRWGTLPFYPATKRTLYDAIRDLLSSQFRRDHYTRLGKEHIARYHDEARVVEQLKDIYTRAASGSVTAAA